MIIFLRNKNDKVHEMKNIQKELKMQGSMPSRKRIDFIVIVCNDSPCKCMENRAQRLFCTLAQIAAETLFDVESGGTER